MEHLYICDTYIEYVKVKKRVKSLKIIRTHKVEMERGIITNGFIIDKDSFKEKLDELDKSLKFKVSKLNAVIETNGIGLKKVIIPKKVKVNFDKFIKLGFKDIEEKEKAYLYTYRTLNIQDENKYILASNVEKERIDDYIDVFKGVDWNIKSICSANSLIVNSILSQNLSNKSFCFIYLVNDILNINFFENGIHSLNFRTRIFETDDEFNSKVIENIINLFRFNKINPDIEYTLYAVGLNEDIINSLNESNYKVVDKGVENLEQWTYPYLYFNAYIKNKNRFNYKNSLKNYNKLKIGRSGKVVIVFLSLFFMTLIGIAVSLKSRTNELVFQYKRNNYDIEEMKKDNRYIKYNEIIKYQQYLNNKLTNIKDVYNYITNNIESLTSEQLSEVYSISNKYIDNGITISEYNYNRESNILTIIGYSEDIKGPLNYSKELRLLNIFDDVIYNLKEKDIDNLYYFSIDCVVYKIQEEEIEQEIDEESKDELEKAIDEELSHR